MLINHVSLSGGNTLNYQWAGAPISFHFICHTLEINSSLRRFSIFFCRASFRKRVIVCRGKQSLNAIDLRVSTSYTARANKRGALGHFLEAAANVENPLHLLR